MFVCKVCGNEVKAGQPFCPTCGADVVDNHDTICPVCGTKNSAGSKFCAKCGGILQTLRKPKCACCGAENLPGAMFCVVCGGPLKPDAETHSDEDMLEARNAKRRLDTMERERMAAVDKEIAEKRAKTEEECSKKAKMLDDYRNKLNELGAEDVEMLKKVSGSLKDQAKYYADPYSQMDEDDIEDEVYVCPACGTVNPNTATKCSHCGRSKARALLLLAKGKIKQSPPIKRKKDVIPSPENDLERTHVPTFDEFAEDYDKPPVAPVEENADAPAQEPVQEQPVKKEEPKDFAGPARSPYGYPYPPYGYPYPPYGYPYPPYGYPQQEQQVAKAAEKEENKASLVEEADVEAEGYDIPVAKLAPEPEFESEAYEVPVAELVPEKKEEPVKEEPKQEPIPQYPPYMMYPNPYMANPIPYQMPPIIQPIAFVPYVTQEQPLVQYSPQVADQVAQGAPAPQQPVQPTKNRKAK